MKLTTQTFELDIDNRSILRKLTFGGQDIPMVASKTVMATDNKIPDDSEVSYNGGAVKAQWRLPGGRFLARYPFYFPHLYLPEISAMRAMSTAIWLGGAGRVRPSMIARINSTVPSASALTMPSREILIPMGRLNCRQMS